MDFVLEPMKHRDIFSIHVTEIQPMAGYTVITEGVIRPFMSMVIGGSPSVPDTNHQ